MDYERYCIVGHHDNKCIGMVDPGGSTDEPGVRCMFGWGAPVVVISLKPGMRQKYGHQILTEDAHIREITLVTFGYDGVENRWADLGIIDGRNTEEIQRLLIRD